MSNGVPRRRTPRSHLRIPCHTRHRLCRRRSDGCASCVLKRHPAPCLPASGQSQTLRRHPFPVRGRTKPIPGPGSPRALASPHHAMPWPAPDNCSPTTLGACRPTWATRPPTAPARRSPCAPSTARREQPRPGPGSAARTYRPPSVPPVHPSEIPRAEPTTRPPSGQPRTAFNRWPNSQPQHRGMRAPVLRRDTEAQSGGSVVPGSSWTSSVDGVSRGVVGSGASRSSSPGVPGGRGGSGLRCASVIGSSPAMTVGENFAYEVLGAVEQRQRGPGEVVRGR